MKAIVQEGYGSADVLRLREVEVPALPDDRVLVKVRAASVNALDWHTVHGGAAMRAMAAAMRQPLFPIRGADLAGEIAAVGKDITRLRPGDAVFGTARGTLAEYAIGREDRLAVKPAQLSFEQAATLGVAPITALQGLRDAGGLRSGQRVLVYGAGGGVGTFAVQIAKALGAHVTAATSTRNLEIVRSLGADAVFDYTQDDLAARPERYDVFLDVAANRSFAACKRVLTPTGVVVMTGAGKGSTIAPLTRMVGGLVRTRLGDKRLRSFLAAVRYDDLMVLKGLVEAGKLCPVIDRQYPLEQAAEAIRYLGTGQARAKVVVNVS